MRRILSGIQPSGIQHLGNYFGAIQQHLELQREISNPTQALYFIANYHSLTTMTDASLLKQYTVDIALDYLALGLDPTKSTLFLQSDIPEVCELAWILSCCVGAGVLERSHAYKDKVDKGLHPSAGLFYYPILMAADILLYKSTIVPVGRDQLQHIEIAQDIAGSFNHRFNKKVLEKPVSRLSNAPVVPGIDGQKMSKSYGNTIPIFPSDNMTEKQIFKNYFSCITTDLKGVEDPKDPNDTLITLYRLLDPEKAMEFEPLYLKGGIGYGELKKKLYESYVSMFGEAQDRRRDQKTDVRYVNDFLETGAKTARKIACQTLSEVRETIGLYRIFGLL